MRGRRKTSGLSIRPRPLAFVSQIKSNAGVVWGPDSVSGKGEGEASSEKALVGRAIESDAGGSDEVVSGKVLRHGFLMPVSSSSLEEEAVLALGAAESSSTGEVSLARVCEKGKVATRHSSPEKGMLRRGFLLRRSSRVVLERADCMRRRSGCLLLGQSRPPWVWI